MNTQFQPCIQYERTFDITEDHDSHKLVVDYTKPTNRSAGKKNIRRVQDLDVEEILHRYDIFVDACDDLGMPVDRKRWNKIVADREIDHSREGFKTTVQAYINAIIPDPDAKGTMIEAFEHHHMAKPKEVSERAHFNRIDTILNYIDMLPRDNDHNLTELQRKRMFFKTHPKSWQDSYMDTAVNFREVTILQIRDYMTRRKDRADKTERGKNNRTPSIREQEGGKQKDIQRGNDERENIRRDDCSFAQCKRHPNGNHTWEHRRSGGQFGGRGNGAGRGPNQNDYGRRAGGQGNGAGAGREPVSNNESNYNQWWGQDNSNYHGDAYSNITASEASYHAPQGQGQNPYQY
eukprot:jgi/Psemu1/58982/gm1.58982_g